MLALTSEQVIYVTIIATLLVELLKFVLKKWKNIKMSKLVVTIIVYVFSMILAYLFLAPIIPASTDPIALTNSILQIALSVFAYATLVYNLLLDKVITGLGNLIESVKAANGAE
jgi:hypothetical protein